MTAVGKRSRELFHDGGVRASMRPRLERRWYGMEEKVRLILGLRVAKVRDFGSRPVSHR